MEGPGSTRACLFTTHNLRIGQSKAGNVPKPRSCMGDESQAHDSPGANFWSCNEKLQDGWVSCCDIVQGSGWHAPGKAGARGRSACAPQLASAPHAPSGSSSGHAQSRRLQGAASVHEGSSVLQGTRQGMHTSRPMQGHGVCDSAKQADASAPTVAIAHALHVRIHLEDLGVE